MTKTYSLIIFDWDGTLIDSIPRIVTCFYKSFDAMNIPRPPEADIKATIGKPLLDAWHILVPDRPEDCERFIEIYREFWLDPQLALSPLFDGVMDMLADLHAQGYKMAVATGKSRLGLERELNHHGGWEYFATTRCAGEARSKPDPQMLEDILTELEVSAADAIMIGDASLDLDMAHNIELDSVAVPTGGATRETLLACNPTAFLDVVTHLPDWLKTQSEP